MTARLIYGFHPVRELLRSRPQSIRRLWCSARGERLRVVRELAVAGGIPVESTTDAEITRVLVDEEGASAAVVGAVHNGCLARVDDEAPPDRTAADPELVVLLEDVQDPRNLGALLRVCEGAGVGRVLIRDRGSAPISPVVVKASAGAAELVPCERIVNSAQRIEELKAQGFWCYGADSSGSPPWEVDLRGPLVLCVGGEGSGLRSRTLELCDGTVGLPMKGRVASLNVATAASALLYEALRQRSVTGDRS